MEKDIMPPFSETTVATGLGINTPKMVCVEIAKYDLINDERLLIPFIMNGKFGMLNRKSEEILPPEYDAILDECRSKLDYVRVCKNQFDDYKDGDKHKVYHHGYYGVIDYKGSFVVEPKYARIDFSNDKKKFIVRDYEKGWGVLNTKSEILVPFGEYRWNSII